MGALFLDRRDAGRQLGERLRVFGSEEPVILALPRGGVPVAYEVAKTLDAPLDVLLVRKLGTPGQRELAMGAVASGGVVVVNQDVLAALGLPNSAIEAAIGPANEEIREQERVLRGSRPPIEIDGRLILLIDDGLATGATMRAAAQAVAAKKARRIVVGVPVAARETALALRHEVDEVVCLWAPEPFSSVGQWYRDFAQTSDAEVLTCLEANARRLRAAQPGPGVH